MLLLTEICALLVTVVVACLCWYLYCVKSSCNFFHDNQAANVIDIIEALKELCPVGPQKNWGLMKSSTGSPRCWERDFPLKMLDGTIKIFGCRTIVKTSSLALLRMIANTTNWMEWKPLTLCQKFSIEPFEDKELRNDDFMRCAKIVTRPSGMELYRFSHLAVGNLGWVLLWNINKLDWSFFLVQPLRKSELDQCMLTHIFGCYPLLVKGKTVKQLISTVNSIKDAVEVNSVSVIPIHLTMPIKSRDSNQSHTIMKSKNVSNNHSFIQERKNSRKLSNSSSKVLKIVPCTSFSQASMKNLKCFTLSAGNLVDSSSASNIWHNREASSSSYSNDEEAKLSQVIQNKAVRSVYSIHAHIIDKMNKNFQCNGKVLSSTSKATDCDISKKGANTSSTAEVSYARHKSFDENMPTVEPSVKLRRSHNVSLDQELDSKEKLPLKPMQHRCFSDVNLHVRKLSSTMRSSCVSLENLPECDEESISFDEGEGGSSHADYSLDNDHADIPPVLQEYEIVLPEIERSSQWITDVITNGNYSASELQAEVLEASNINLQSSIEDQSFNSRGWMFHSTYRGLTVLIKGSNIGYLKTLSFICEAKFLVRPLDVWQAIKNPHLRFICDETVKKVRILEEISPDQKIVYTYHEAQQWLKKEAMDFCMLHTERREQSKYYLALQSIEYENCPLMDSVTRGTLLPSGWVVEPLSADHESAKVSFLYQVVVNNQSSFSQDLSIFVPLTVCNLKKYVMSHPP